MIRYTAFYLINRLTVLGILLLSGSCMSDQVDSITIATSANALFAVEELAKQFEESAGIECQVVAGSSGALTAQIKAGAPYDVFLSADMAYPQSLSDQGLSLQPPKVFARGQLVLWSMVDSAHCLLGGLADSRISHIAIANPKTAPYGKAAIETLETGGLFQAIEEKLIFGTSISQTNQYITTRSAQVGFTSRSSVLAYRKGYWTEVPPHLYTAIKQGAVIISRSKHPDEGTAFLQFVLSPEGQKVLAHFGYLVQP